ncbi:hypothetical protein [Corynebacterium mayonis]|uniref:hypothetical protein n=1 Tax=Corynebacterium mayonis TaxID=3062461 RepID=UPI00313FE18B
MHRHRTARLAGAIAVSSTLLLAACSNNEPGQPAPAQTSTPETEQSSSASAEAAGTSSSTAGSSAASTSAASKDKDRELVADVAKRFSTLAPASLFDKLETCSETDIRGSYDCSGPEIGQFQLFESEAKAASTTQLLTELRGSRIVSDKGNLVVGWSTLGTSAIITVVDNDKGQVMQQLISSDQEDPRERIYNLGLAERPETQSPTQTSDQQSSAQDETATTSPSAARS